MSSSDASDVGTVIRFEGHTIAGTGSDSQFTFVIQDVALNGQNKVAISTPVARVSRAYVLSGSLAGDFYVFEDDTLTGGVPDTTAKIHMLVEGSAGDTQSYKAATTFSNQDYAILTGGYASVNKKSSAFVDMVLEVRAPGGIFRPATGRISLSTNGTNTAKIDFYPYAIVPKNSDIRVRGAASTTNVSVDATFQAFLAQVRG